jgi:hypothetical protein
MQEFKIHFEFTFFLKLLVMKEILIFFGLYISAVAINLDCIFENHNWATLGIIYTCTVKSSQYLANETYITGFTGTHLSGYSNANVKGIYFQTNCHHIKAVPKNFHEYFPNFIAISMSTCGFTRLEGDELNQYRNLQVFYLTSSELERIPGNLFLFNPSMKLVMLRNNKIKHVGANLLEPIQGNLIELWFLNNVCINQDANTAATISSLIMNLRIYCADSIA